MIQVGEGVIVNFSLKCAIHGLRSTPSIAACGERGAGAQGAGATRWQQTALLFHIERVASVGQEARWPECVFTYSDSEICSASTRIASRAALRASTLYSLTGAEQRWGHVRWPILAGADASSQLTHVGLPVLSDTHLLRLPSTVHGLRP